MEKKKKYLILLGAFIFLLAIVGTTYAFWVINLSQTDKNVISSSCFDVRLEGTSGGITLRRAVPISDDEGMKLDSYDFTITNHCDAKASYQVNMESLQLEGQKLIPADYLKVSLNENEPNVLSKYTVVEKTLDNASESRRLTTGILDERESVTYHLRLWIDYGAPSDQSTMNAYYKSKITVIATHRTEQQLANDVVFQSDSLTQEYNKDSEEVTLTATSDKGNITEYKISKMANSKNWKLVEEPSKTITVTEKFTESGTYYFSVKDELGNETDNIFEVEKVDTSGPNITYEEVNNKQSVELKITIKDSQSGLVKYQVIKEDLTPILLLDESTPDPTEHWELIENTQEDYVITKTIEDNGIYYIYAQDALGYISSMKYSTDIIDKDPPTIELSNTLSDWGESDQIHIILKDDHVGLFGYKVMSKEEEPSEWETIEGNLKEKIVDYSVNENGTYYVYVKDAYDNIAHQSIDIQFIDDRPPVPSLSLTLNGTTIVADASGSVDNEMGIRSYEYKIDGENDFTVGEVRQEFPNLKYGNNYQVTVRVTDGAGNQQETSQSVYTKGTAINVIKDVSVVSDNRSDGIYTVPHANSTLTDANWKATELRYAGGDPNNYVNFNNETGKWRIIGLVNVKTKTGVTQRVKLVRDSIGYYSWDSSPESIDSGQGINEWSQADAMKLMNPGYESNTDSICEWDYRWGPMCNGESGLVNNSLYWNGGSGTCFKQQWSGSTSCGFSSTGGLKNSQAYIADDIIWNTAGLGNKLAEAQSSGTPDRFYDYERSSNASDTGKICTSNTYCNDNVPRKIEWAGLVALPYPSDVAYALNGHDRSTCFNKPILDWNNGSDCNEDPWFSDFSSSFYTLTPMSDSEEAFNIITNYFDSTGAANISYLDLLPALYLKPSIQIVGGSGAQDNPYILSLT